MLASASVTPAADVLVAVAALLALLETVEGQGLLPLA